MKLAKAALAACCALLSAASIDGQTPTPTPSAPPGFTPDAIATITLGNQPPITVNCLQGIFSRVGLQPNQVVSISVKLPAILAGHQIFIESLDGGLVSGTSATVAGDGTFAVQFQAASQPGAYRVKLRDGTRALELQFWVLDPSNPSQNPPIANPGA